MHLEIFLVIGCFFLNLLKDVFNLLKMFLYGFGMIVKSILID